MVVYRVTPADVESGVRVGDVELSRLPGLVGRRDRRRCRAQGRLLRAAPRPGPERAGPRVRPRRGRQRGDGARRGQGLREGRSARAASTSTTRSSAKVVPPILANTPELKVDDPSNLLESYLTINRELRKQNGATITALAEKSAPDRLWQGPFKQLVNSAVESGFADHRTYVYQGRTSTSRCTSASTWPRRRRRRSRPRTPAASCSPSSSASTATAWSSTTAWACSRSTPTCRRSA